MVSTSREAPIFKGELAKSFETPGPSLVVVPIDYRENRLLTQRLGNIAVAI